MTPNKEELLLHISADMRILSKASLRIWTYGFPIKAIVFVWNPRRGEEGQLTTTGPSVRGGVRNPVVDGGPWKLVPNSPLARFPPCLLRQATSACCRCGREEGGPISGVPCYLRDWQVGAPGPYFLTFLYRLRARMKANLGLTSRNSDLQHRQ